MKRASLILFDLLLLVISIAVIVTYLCLPFFQVKVEYVIDADMVQGIVDQYGDQLGDYGDIDVSSAIGNETYTLNATITINPSNLLSSFSGGDTESFVSGLIMDTVEPLIDDLTDILVVVVQSVAATQVTSYAKDYLTTYLNDNSSTTLSDEDVQQILDEAGLTDEYLEEQVNTVIDALTADDANVDDITETVMSVVDDIIATAQSGSSDFADLEYDEETRKEIEDQVRELLEQMSDEDGSVTIDALLAMALQYLNGDDDESALVGTYSAVNSIRVMASSTSSGTSDVRTQLAEAITEIVMDYITADVIQIASYVVMGLAILLLFSCFTWLYIIIKLIVKMFCKNPGIKFKLPVWLGWIPFILFYIMPTAAMSAIKSYIGTLGATATSVLDTLTISFSTSGLYAFIAAIALIIIWIPYHLMRKNRKKELAEVADNSKNGGKKSTTKSGSKKSSDKKSADTVQSKNGKQGSKKSDAKGNAKANSKSQKKKDIDDDDDDGLE